MRYLYFTVRVPEVGEVPAARWSSYIEEAVTTWAGQFEPVDGGYPPDMQEGSGDPLGPPCEWNVEVKVTRQLKRRPDYTLLKNALSALEGLYAFCPDGFSYMPADQAIRELKEIEGKP